MSALPQIAGQGSGTLHGFGVQNYRGEYYMDGGSVRSTYGHGDMPAGVSVDRVEEVQVTTSGQDITNVQGGPTINFVSKRGGNKLAGDAYMALLDKSLQANNTLPASMKTPANQVYKQYNGANVNGLGYIENAGVFRTYDYGMNLGGPIIPDHLWFFGSWAVIDQWNKGYDAAPSDRTYIPDMYGKLNFQWKTLTAEVSYTHRNSSAINVPFSATILGPNKIDRKNPVDIYTAQASITLWQKFLINAKFTDFNYPTLTEQTGFTPTGSGPGTTYDQAEPTIPRTGTTPTTSLKPPRTTPKRPGSGSTTARDRTGPTSSSRATTSPSTSWAATTNSSSAPTGTTPGISTSTWPPTSRSCGTTRLTKWVARIPLTPPRSAPSAAITGAISKPMRTPSARKDRRDGASTSRTP